MRAYWEMAVGGYQRWATYPGATLAGVFTNTVFGLMRGWVLLAVLAARPHVGGYDTADALTYVWVAQGFLAIVAVWGWNDLAVRVASGDVAVDLGRPIDFQGQWLATDLGRGFYQLIFRGIPPFLVGELLYRLELPTNPVLWAGFAASAALAIVISFAIRFLVNLCAFWLLDYRGIVNLAGNTGSLLAGFIVPLSFFPDGVRQVLTALPFAGMAQVPIDVFLGKHTGLDLLGTLAWQALWAAVLLLAGRVVLAAGVRRLVLQGG